METFLLDAISNEDEYDADLIKRGKDFVNDADPEKRYLHRRRDVVKAYFDVYFSIRTSATQFNERQNILKNVNWEDYSKIQKDFKLLGELVP